MVPQLASQKQNFECKEPRLFQLQGTIAQCRVSRKHLADFQLFVGGPLQFFLLAVGFQFLLQHLIFNEPYTTLPRIALYVQAILESSSFLIQKNSSILSIFASKRQSNKISYQIKYRTKKNQSEYQKNFQPKMLEWFFSLFLSLT